MYVFSTYKNQVRKQALELFIFYFTRMKHKLNKIKSQSAKYVDSHIITRHIIAAINFMNIYNNRLIIVFKSRQ